MGFLLSNQAREKTNKLGIRRAMFVRQCEKERTEKKKECDEKNM